MMTTLRLGGGLSYDAQCKALVTIAEVYSIKAGDEIWHGD